MLQWVRSLVYTTLLFACTMAFGVAVLVSAVLPLTIEQRYVIPRNWGLFHTWLAKVVCGLGYVVEGRENLPKGPFVSLWKHSSTWDTLAQMFVVPTAAWLLKREVTWIPIVGWAVSTYKPIAINRRAGHSAVNQVVKQGKERLAAGMGEQMLTLVFSRDDESEADLVGMELAARAGYDPAAGITLWRKMGAASKGAPPEFLSTHPSGPTRIKDIEANLPKVEGLYRRAPRPTRRFEPPPVGTK